MGMKTGAGEDPFADEVVDDQGGDPDESDEPARTETAEPAGTAEGRRAGDRSSSSRKGGGRATGGADTGDGSVQAPDLPFIARRNARGDTIKAGREKRRLFELRPEIAEKEEPFMTELSRELGVDVTKTDAREAALAVIYENPDLVAERLEEWGITYFDG